MSFRIELLKNNIQNVNTASVAHNAYTKLNTMFPQYVSKIPNAEQNINRFLTDLVLNIDTLPKLLETCKQYAKIGSQYGLSKSTYHIVSNALISAMKDQSGDSWNVDLERAWNDTGAMIMSYL